MKKKIRKIFLIYIKYYIKYFVSKMPDRNIFNNAIFPMIKLYYKHKKFFDNEMKTIFNFILFSFSNRNQTKNKDDIQKIYLPIIEKLLSV